MMKAGVIILGVVLILYGFAGLMFEVYNESYSEIALITWTLFNPIFVFYAKVAYPMYSMYPMSFFASFATSHDAIATLLYWAYPLLIAWLGFLLVYLGCKKA